MRQRIRRRVAAGHVARRRALAIVVGWLPWLGLVAVPGLAAQESPPPRTPGAAASQTREATAARQAERYAVPESPAFTFLSASPAKVTRPATPRDFGVALMDGIDEAGRARQGFALEVSPHYLIPGYTVTLREYQRNAFKYAISNTQLSVGTVQSTGDTTSTDLAYGLRIAVIDQSDPWQNDGFANEIGTKFLACAPPEAGPAFPPGASETERKLLIAVDSASRRQCLRDTLTAVRERFVKRYWNATRLTLAYAHGTRLKESRLSDRSELGDRLWAVGAARVGPSAQAIGYLEWSRMRAQPASQAYSAVAYGGRFLIGSPTFNFFYELVGDSRYNTDDGVDKRTSSWSAGLEFLAADNLWLSTGLGERADAAAAPDRTVLIANIRWGIAKQARFAP